MRIHECHFLPGTVAESAGDIGIVIHAASERYRNTSLRSVDPDSSDSDLLQDYWQQKLLKH